MSQAKRGRKRNHGSGSIRATKGRSWEGRATIDGKPVRFNLGVRKDVDPRRGLTRTQAEKRLREEIQNYAPRLDGMPTFSDVAAAHIRKREALNRKRSTTKEYESYVRLYFKDAFGDKRIDKITKGDVERLQAKLLNDAAPASVVLWMTVLNGIFNHAIKEGWIAINPVAQVDKVKLHKSDEVNYLTKDQLGEVIAQIPDDDWAQTERVLYRVGAMTGLRRGELVGVRWRHIDWLARKVRVLINTVDGKDGTPKSGRGRTVPLPDVLIKLLEKWSQETAWGADDDRVFPNPISGEALDATKLTKRFRAAIIRGGIGEFRPVEKKDKIVMEPVLRLHLLRHTFGVAMAKNPKVSLMDIKLAMGHSDIKTTMRYAQFQPGQAAAERAEETFADFATVEPEEFPDTSQIAKDHARSEAISGDH